MDEFLYADMTLRDHFAAQVTVTPADISSHFWLFGDGADSSNDREFVQAQAKVEARIRWLKADALLATRGEVRS